MMVAVRRPFREAVEWLMERDIKWVMVDSPPDYKLISINIVYHWALSYLYLNVGITIYGVEIQHDDSDDVLDWCLNCQDTVYVQCSLNLFLLTDGIDLTNYRKRIISSLFFTDEATAVLAKLKFG
jgi:hypothetical protein